MKGIFNNNITFMKAFFTLLICVTFFSFYTTSLFGTNLNIRKVSDGGSIRSVNQIQTITNAYDQVNIENEESIFGKIILISQHKIFGGKLFFAYLYLFIILSLYILSEYFEGWLFLASQSRCKLLLVEYIQQKDGKKHSRPNYYSF